MASNGNINPNQIRHEIETLKSQKQEIEARLSLLQSQLHQQQHSSCTNDSCPPISAVQGTQEEDNNLGKQATHVKLIIVGQEGDEVVVRMKRSCKFKKLMKRYCDRKSVDFHSIAFLFGSGYLHSSCTPDELKMKDDDIVDVISRLP